MRRADVVFPSAATKVGVPELATVLKHFQDHVAAVTDEAFKSDGASAATSKAIAICNVAEMRKLASAVAAGAGGSFVDGDGHDCQEVVEALAPDDRTIQHSEAGALGAPASAFTYRYKWPISNGLGVKGIHCFSFQ